MIMSEEALAVAPTPTPTTPTLTPTSPSLVDYAVNASAGPGGTISPSGCLFAYPGSSFTFKVAPNPGYKILDVSDNGVSKGALQTYELWNVQTGHEILATFSKITEAPLVDTYGIVIVAVAVVSVAAIAVAAVVLIKRNSKLTGIMSEYAFGK